MGRPTVFSERLALALTALAQKGATDQELANAAGVSVMTIYRWKLAHPDFCYALKGMRDLADDLMEESLYQSGVSGNVTAQIFWLKNRRPDRWRDKHEIVDARAESDSGVPDATFDEFCERAGYPLPYPKQEEMRAFVFDQSEKARLLLGARGYGKTDYTTILGSAFKIYQERQYRILIMTKSDEKNAAIVDEIAKALQANGIGLEKDNALYLRTRGLHGKDHSVSSVTVGSSSLRGRHPDLVIMDDPVTEEDISEATRNKLQRKYNELQKLCQNIAIIGQPVHVFDLYETLRPLVEVMEVPHGMIPELDHDLEAMKLAGVSETSINASYHLKVTSETGNPLSGVSYVDKFPAGDCVAFIDPSFRGGDYTAMSVGRAYFDGVAIQGFCWKKAWFDCIPEIKTAAAALGIRKICFETNALGLQPLSVLRAELQGIGITGRDSTGYKHSRIMAAGTFAKLIHLAKTSHRVYIDQVVKYEYGSKFDDAPDSLASLLSWLGLIKGKA